MHAQHVVRSAALKRRSRKGCCLPLMRRRSSRFKVPHLLSTHALHLSTDGPFVGLSSGHASAKALCGSWESLCGSS